MNLMTDAASTVQDITTDVDNGFAIPVTFSKLDGATLIEKTCGAVVILHGLLIDENGIATVSVTSRLMVSELALQAVAFPTRDIAGKLILKDCTVVFTDVVTSTELSFVIRTAFENRMTGLVSCQLGRGTTV